MATDNRNVIDHYKSWSDACIRDDLNAKRHNFSVLCWNLAMDFNIATVVRNANAFLADTVYIYGKKRWDRRGAVGTQNYENIKYVKFLEDLKDLPQDAVWVGVDNLPGAEPVETFKWPRDKHVLMCFGMEQLGLQKEILDRCQHLVYIKQYGSVRSLNVGVASGVCMYDYVRKIEC